MVKTSEEAPRKISKAVKKDTAKKKPKETLSTGEGESVVAVPVTSPESNTDVGEMTAAGLQFGHKTSRVDPKMKVYLYGARNGIHIFDLEKTKEKFDGALNFIRGLVSQGKIILFVGTKIQTKNLIKQVAQECGLPYVSERWLGGTLTNIDTILKRIAYFKDLEQKKSSGMTGKYTKKEQANFDKELKEMETKFSGIKNMNQLPDAVFVADIMKDSLAVKEARSKNISVIGIADTNCNPDLINYPIPANDDSVSSVQYILEKVKEAILNAKLKTQSEKITA